MPVAGHAWELEIPGEVVPAAVVGVMGDDDDIDTDTAVSILIEVVAGTDADAGDSEEGEDRETEGEGESGATTDGEDGILAVKSLARAEGSLV